LLPITLFVLVFTTIFNTATIPFLGFAYFIIGFPKPQKGQHNIVPVMPNPNDQKSDGALYQALVPQLKKQLEQVIQKDLFAFKEGSLYFLKNEKMIILVQTLERGNGYVVLTIKGAELQEQTVCHAEENGKVQEVIESVFEKKERGKADFEFVLAPYSELKFAIYDDQKVALTGLIDSPDFSDCKPNSS